MDSTAQANNRLAGRTSSPARLVPDRSSDNTSTPIARLARSTTGFALPVVIVALLTMSVLAAGAVMTTMDDGRASRAVHRSARGFYAAEAGVNEAWTTWPVVLVSALAPGETLDLGVTLLDDGGRYGAAVQRVDDGFQQLYWLRVWGEGPGGSGQRLMSLFLRLRDQNPLERAAAVSRGAVHLGDDDRGGSPGCGWGCRANGLPWIIGADGVPASWDPDACAAPGDDKPALIIDDLTNLDTHPENDLLHQAPQPASQSITDLIVQDTTIGDATFQRFGGASASELRAIADHVLPPWDGLSKRTTYPTLNPDGTCDTSDMYNWGSPDPNHPCYNYHPIIVVPDGAHIGGVGPDGSCGYGQAIVLANGPLKLGHHDCDGGAAGSDPDPQPYEFAGIVVGVGCVQLLYATRFAGSVIVDDDMSNSSHLDCNVSGGYASRGIILNQNGTLRFSSCAVRKALAANALEAAIRGWQRMPTRSFLVEQF